MAAGELTGASPLEVEEMKEEHKESPLYQDHGIPFETAYCLRKIGKQPDFYDGPQRFCKRRAAKKDEDDYEGTGTDKAAFAVCCHTHGGDLEKQGDASRLDNPRTAGITHGAYAKDRNLIMDFTDEEKELYDSIMHDWPEIYDWPPRSEDPARYRILRRVAVNEVRAMREEDYLEDEGEVYQEPQFDEQGVEVGHKDTENPISREYRLLMKEVTNQMKELGLTPKERQKMDTLSAQESKEDALSQIANDALHGDDQDYDPDQFGAGDDD